MPIRIVCPSCSAALSVKDEFAGRAVKCPKCGGIIPATQAAPPPAPPEPPPAPPPEPAKSPFEELDEPARPAKVTAKPVAKSKDSDEDDEDRPRRKNRDEDDEDRGSRSKRGDRDDRDDRDDDDRPRKRRRDEDDRPARGEKKKGGAGLVIGIIGGVLLLCCGGVGGVGYWLYTKAKKGVEDFVENITPKNDKVTAANYQKLKFTMTRAEVEAILGPGRLAPASEVNQVFIGQRPALLNVWVQKANEGKVLIWRNRGDCLLVVLHQPSVGRLQFKAFIPQNGSTESAGIGDEVQFAKMLESTPPDENPPKGPGNPPGNGGNVGGNDDEPPAGVTPTEVSAEELAQAYKDNEAAADTKYKNKWLRVEGKVKYMQPGDGMKDSPSAQLDGVKSGKFDLLVWCFGRPDEANKVLNLARGQTVTFEGKCLGNPAKTFVRLDHCRVKGTGPDPAIKISASDLIREFTKDAEAANEKYKDKEVLVTDAEFTSVGNSLANFNRRPGKKGGLYLQANFAFNQNEKLSKLKPGNKVKFRAKAGLLFGSGTNQYVSFYEAYLVP